MSRYTGPTPEVRETVMVRAFGRCEHCGAPDGPFQWHHRRPRGMGGTRRPETNLPSALLYVQESCHAEIESRRTDSLTAGWLVSQHADPADIPVRTPSGLVYLTTSGGYRPAEETA